MIMVMEICLTNPTVFWPKHKKCSQILQNALTLWGSYNPEYGIQYGLSTSLPRVPSRKVHVRTFVSTCTLRTFARLK